VHDERFSKEGISEASIGGGDQNLFLPLLRKREYSKHLSRKKGINEKVSSTKEERESAREKFTSSPIRRDPKGIEVLGVKIRPPW